MRYKQWQQMVFSLVLIGGAAFPLLAQEAGPAKPAASVSAVRGNPPAMRGSRGFPGLLEQRLGLTAEQRDAVRGLMAQQREQMAAVRRTTDGKIRALLTPEQQKRFDALLSEQRAGRRALARS